jgi:tetratricopeptide (TPR) repeat protein
MVEERKVRSKLTVSRALIPILCLFCLFFFWKSGWRTAALPLVVLFLIYYFVFPRLIQLRLERFNREALRLLTMDRAQEVPSLVRKNVFLQLFGPRAPLDAKLGLAYAYCGDYGRAVVCLRSGLKDATSQEQTPLQSGLVKSLFMSGDLVGAESHANVLIDRGTKLPEILTIAARCRLGLGKLDGIIHLYLQEASELSPTPDVKLMIDLTAIEVALASGQEPQELPAGVDSNNRHLNAWIHLVRGKIRQNKGKLDKAKASFSKAARLGKGGFVEAAISDFSSNSQTPAVSGSARDPAVRRKRKRRSKG